MKIEGVALELPETQINSIQEYTVNSTILKSLATDSPIQYSESIFNQMHPQMQFNPESLPVNWGLSSTGGVIRQKRNIHNRGPSYDFHRKARSDGVQQQVHSPGIQSRPVQTYRTFSGNYSNLMHQPYQPNFPQGTNQPSNFQQYRGQSQNYSHSSTGSIDINIPNIHSRNHSQSSISSSVDLNMNTMLLGMHHNTSNNIDNLLNRPVRKNSPDINIELNPPHRADTNSPIVDEIFRNESAVVNSPIVDEIFRFNKPEVNVTNFLNDVTSNLESPLDDDVTCFWDDCGMVFTEMKMLVDHIASHVPVFSN